MNSRTIGIAVAAALVAAVLGYWGYGAHKTRAVQSTAVRQVTDAAVRLREALTILAGRPEGDAAQTVQKLDEHAAAVDHGLQELKRLGSSSHQALADAADDYLLTAREILKRQAESQRYRSLWRQSWQALRDHLRHDTRTGAWVQQAVKARERVNRDFRGYSMAAETLEKLLESLAASQKRIAPYTGAGSLIADGLVAKARGRVLDDLQRATAEMDKLKQLDALR
jgi:exonuclease VII large subunit